MSAIVHTMDVPNFTKKMNLRRHISLCQIEFSGFLKIRKGYNQPPLYKRSLIKALKIERKRRRIIRNSSQKSSP